LIRLWNMDGGRSVPLWRDADHTNKGPDVLKGHSKMVVGLAAGKNYVRDIT
jgi:hypothetical protein